MKIFLKYLKKFVLGAFLLYGYNLIAITFNIAVPINVFSVVVVGFLDVFGLLALIILRIIGL